jgi:hypothetical protein
MASRSSVAAAHASSGVAVSFFVDVFRSVASELTSSAQLPLHDVIGVGCVLAEELDQVVHEPSRFDGLVPGFSGPA